MDDRAPETETEIANELRDAWAGITWFEPATLVLRWLAQARADEREKVLRDVSDDEALDWNRAYRMRSATIDVLNSERFATNALLASRRNKQEPAVDAVNEPDPVVVGNYDEFNKWRPHLPVDATVKAQVTISEEMVERGCLAYWRSSDRGHPWEQTTLAVANNIRKWMRAVLADALHPLPTPSTEAQAVVEAARKWAEPWQDGITDRKTTAALVDAVIALERSLAPPAKPDPRKAIVAAQVEVVCSDGNSDRWRVADDILAALDAAAAATAKEAGK